MCFLPIIPLLSSSSMNFGMPYPPPRIPHSTTSDQGTHDTTRKTQPSAHVQGVNWFYHTLGSGSVQFSLSVMSATPWTAACQASLSITTPWRLLKLMSIELVMLSNHSYSVVPFSSHLQSCPASGSFQMSQFFTSGGQSIEVSASASVLPMNIQD